MALTGLEKNKCALCGRERREAALVRPEWGRCAGRCRIKIEGESAKGQTRKHGVWENGSLHMFVQ